MAKPTLADLDSLPKVPTPGIRWYFTGEPCKRGHLAARYASTRSCVVCQRGNTRDWKNDHLELVRERNREQKAQAYAKDPETFIQRVRNHYQNNKEQKQAYNKDYRANNLERMREQERVYREEQRALIKKRRQLSRPKHRERIRTANRNRKARLRKAEGYHTAADIRRIRAEQNDQCKLCHKDLDGKGHVDHIIPLARGGTNWPDNLQILCEPCNCSKGAKILIKRPRGAANPVDLTPPRPTT